MALSDEAVGGMTLSDLEAVASRFGAAVRTIREAQALLGGSAPAVVAPPVSLAPPPENNFNPREKAERARLLRGIRGDDIPPDIAAMEQT